MTMARVVSGVGLAVGLISSGASAWPDKLTFGVDYYPEAWGSPGDEAQWRADAAAMAAAGIRNVRVAEFAWHLFQPNASAAFQFEWLDSALAVLAEHNITAIVGTPTASPPAWMVAADPDLQLVTADGVQYRYGSRQNTNHAHAAFRNASAAIAEAIGRHYANDPRVVAFQLDNELGAPDDFSAETLAAWHDWLAAKYEGNVTALNAAWGTVFWSHTLNSFEEAPAPWNTYQGSVNPGLGLDWRRFISDVATGYLQLQATTLRAAAPGKLLTTNAFNGGVDYAALGRSLDVMAADLYPTLGLPASALWPAFAAPALYAGPYNAAVLRGARNQQPIIVTEQQAGPAGQAVYYGSAIPELTRLLAWQSVANGADLVQFFRWRTTRVGFEQHWEGVLDWDGRTDNGKYAHAAALGAEFAKASDAVVGARVRARVALLISTETDWALQVQQLTQPALSTQPQRMALFAAFRSRGLGVDLVHVPADSRVAPSPSPALNLTGYDIVLAPTLWVAPDAVAAELAAFVAGGGHLLLTMRSGSKTSTNAYTDLPLPGPFAPLAGVRTRVWDPMCSFAETAVNFTDASFGVSTTQGRICEVVEPWAWGGNGTAAEALGVYAAGYYAGKPAVTRRAGIGPGGGSVIYAGTVSDEQGFADHLAALLAADAGLPFGPALPVAVEVSIRDRPGGGSTVFVLNFKVQPEALDVPAAAGGTDLLTGQRIDGSGSVALQPWGVAVISVPLGHRRLRCRRRVQNFSCCDAGRGEGAAGGPGTSGIRCEALPALFKLARDALAGDLVPRRCMLACPSPGRGRTAQAPGRPERAAREIAGMRAHQGTGLVGGWYT